MPLCRHKEAEFQFCSVYAYSSDSLFPFLFLFLHSFLLSFSWKKIILAQLLCTFLIIMLIIIILMLNLFLSSTLQPQSEKELSKSFGRALTLQRRQSLKYRSGTLLLQTNACFSPGLAEECPMGKSYPAVEEILLCLSSSSWSQGSICKFFVKSDVRRNVELLDHAKCLQLKANSTKPIKLQNICLMQEDT